MQPPDPPSPWVARVGLERNPTHEPLAEPGRLPHLLRPDHADRRARRRRSEPTYRYWCAQCGRDQDEYEDLADCVRDARRHIKE